MKAGRAQSLEKVLPIVAGVLKKYGIKKAGIFGSYARGEQNSRSDVDIIIEPSKGLGLFNFVGIKLELEEKLHLKVDLLTYNSLNKYLKKRVLQEEMKII